MAKERGTQVGSIENILEMAFAQQRSGLLHIERVQGGRLQEGELYLIAGQPIYARAGTLIGVEALSYLSGWQNVQLSFVANVPMPPMNIFSRPRMGGSRITPRFLSSREPDVASQQYDMDAFEASAPGEQRVPLKIRPEHVGLARPLTRRQRLIHLLVNGKRTVADLARTSGKTVNEVEIVLRELEEQELIGE